MNDDETPWLITKENKDGEITSASINTGILADTILQNGHNCYTLDDTDEILLYKKGVYARGEPSITSHCQKTIGAQMIKNNHVTEVLGYIRRATYMPREYFNQDTTYISLENGVLLFEERTLREHDPAYMTTIKLPQTYDPDADCPEIKEFLNEILHEDDINVIQEVIGDCLIRSYKHQKATMLLGNGQNGKSTLLQLIEKFLGNENISNVSLQELGENKFARGHLFGKLSNICADIPNRKIKNSGIFKMLTGGDRIYAEQKFKNPYAFRNHAKLIFSANQLPPVDDDTDAFFRRWIIINLPNQFSGEDADKDKINKLTTRKELSGLLNWALEGLERLNKYGFSNSKETDELRDEYIRKSDPEHAFILDCIEPGDESVIDKDVLYGAYVSYCDHHKLPKVSKPVFSRDHLTMHVKNLKAVRPTGKDGKRYNGWQGIQFTEDVLMSGVLGEMSGVENGPLTQGPQKTFMSGITGVNLLLSKSEEELCLEDNTSEYIKGRDTSTPDTPDTGTNEKTSISGMKDKFAHVLKTIKIIEEMFGEAKLGEIQDKCQDVDADEIVHILASMCEQGILFEPKHQCFKVV